MYDGLHLEIGKFFSTPLYHAANGRFETEVVGFEIELDEKDQVKLFFPDGKQQAFSQCKTDQQTPVELLYAGRFDEAKAAYKLILKSDPKGEVVNDAELADTALLHYWDLVKEKGRTEAKKCARMTLELAIELFDEAPMSEYSLRFYR